MENSAGAPSITISDQMKKNMDNLRAFLFANVYVGSAAKSEEQKAKNIIRMLFKYWLKHPQQMGSNLYKQNIADGMERCVADYIAGMTDRYIIAVFGEIFLPRPWKS
jgi:dGTPase